MRKEESCEKGWKRGRETGYYGMEGKGMSGWSIISAVKLISNLFYKRAVGIINS